ncbi:hypothetical protein DYU05_06800 [Mucilaginibacter terrenus]|uniref:Uncharacterized protein n=1 Tax=Mucilaginibacter terrenus TaxID=2482727 RepID=A0A3E2NWF9_9SPHI|nr:hypothetical protein [Mucilaginibacter terrenus]RFZ85299.1 hypothetical protein DYU05_06800 [Mucilaginibacter terrenus]
MITIYHQSNDNDIVAWKDRLEQLIVKHEFVVQDQIDVSTLVDDEEIVKGKQAIENYLEGLEQFVNGWYEDHCDMYNFNA